MKDLMQHAADCMEMLEAIDIECGDVLEWKINTRAKKRLGQTRMMKFGYSINISSRLLEDSIDDDVLDNVIIHELLHTCAGCFNHGEKWKALGDKVYKEYGLRIKRTYSSAEFGIEYHPQSEYKYILKCQCCGAEIKRMRKSNAVKYPSLYNCGRCHGQLKRIA